MGPGVDGHKSMTRAWSLDLVLFEADRDKKSSFVYVAPIHQIWAAIWLTDWLASLNLLQTGFRHFYHILSPPPAETQPQRRRRSRRQAATARDSTRCAGRSGRTSPPPPTREADRERARTRADPCGSRAKPSRETCPRPPPARPPPELPPRQGWQQGGRVLPYLIWGLRAKFTSRLRQQRQRRSGLARRHRRVCCCCRLFFVPSAHVVPHLEHPTCRMMEGQAHNELLVATCGVRTERGLNIKRDFCKRSVNRWLQRFLCPKPCDPCYVW